VPDTSCDLEVQLQVQVSVVRTSDNKTAELLNTRSQMCNTCWYEGWKDPTILYWKQSVESVIEGVRFKVCMVQSSTAWYRDGQISSDGELQEDWRDPKGLESMTFHSFWIGFHFGNPKTADDEGDPDPADNEDDSNSIILVKQIPKWLAMANLSWH